MIAELQDEKERLDEAILALERLAVGTNRRRSPHAVGWLKQNGVKGAAMPDPENGPTVANRPNKLVS